MNDDIFLKIIDREIPAKIEYEDDDLIVIHDINPKAPLHLLIIPKKMIPTLHDLDEEEDRDLVSKMIFKARDIADEKELAGYQVKFHVNEKGGQEVFHLHMHLLGWYE